MNKCNKVRKPEKHRKEMLRNIFNNPTSPRAPAHQTIFLWSPAHCVCALKQSFAHRLGPGKENGCHLKQPDNKRSIQTLAIWDQPAKPNVLDGSIRTRSNGLSTSWPASDMWFSDHSHKIQRQVRGNSDLLDSLITTPVIFCTVFRMVWSTDFNGLKRGCTASAACRFQTAALHEC